MMSNTDHSEQSLIPCPSSENSASCLQDIQLRTAEIGNGTLIKRALPHRDKRMIGAWCFLDHAGPVQFDAGQGLDVGPHPHIGLQTFTWMIEGTIMHTDSLGSKQLIRPKQVNLMTAGHGISHTEVAPAHETQMHTAQLWIALPDHKRDMPPQFDHYPDLPNIEQDGAHMTVLVGDYLQQHSPVAVHTPLVGVDIQAQVDLDLLLPLNPTFEYGLMVLEGEANINQQVLNHDNMLITPTAASQFHLQCKKGSRILLIGGEPFATEIILWWNLVARSGEEIAEARQQWIEHDPRFGTIPDYQGERLVAPTMPDKMRASK